MDVSGRIANWGKRNGYQFSGYVHSLGTNGIKHVLKGHGEGAETRWDQRPVTPKDFEQIPDVIARPDSIELSPELSGEGHEVIIIKKKIAKDTFFVLEEIVDDSKRLVLKTAYIKLERAATLRVNEPSRKETRQNDEPPIGISTARRAMPQDETAPRKRPKRPIEIASSKRSVSNNDVSSQPATAHELRLELRGDPVLGDAITTLENNGKLVIVDKVSDLPEPLRTKLTSQNGEKTQAVYVHSSKTAYLIAENTDVKSARGVVLHEVGVHMAADQNYRKDMSALIARARQIVMNGKRNGDKTAGRVYQRMVDAGLIDENGKVDPANQDEFFAYLVEELANAKTDQGIIPAIKRWFTDVLAKVKTWLYDHGLISSNQLNQRDLLTIAKGNAEGLSKNLGERSGSGDVRIKKSVVSDVGLKDTVKDKIDGGKRTLRDSVRRNLGGDWGAPLQKDELGKTKFAWGEHIVVGGTNVALDVAESFLPAIRSVRYLPKDMRKIIRRYAAQVDKAVQDSGEISTDMQTYSANDRKLISDVIEDMVQTGVNPPAHVVRAKNSRTRRRSKTKTFQRLNGW